MSAKQLIMRIVSATVSPFVAELDAAEENFAVINAGHFETENLPFLMLKEKLEKEFDEVEFMEAPVSNPILEI